VMTELGCMKIGKHVGGSLLWTSSRNNGFAEDLL
jgi:hypothetical protein